MPAVIPMKPRLRPNLPRGNSLANSALSNFILDLPDEYIEKLQFSVPWQYDSEDADYSDPDGFDPPKRGIGKSDPKQTRDVLQEECWHRFHRNPQMNSAVWDMIGRIVGLGFDVSSAEQKISDVINEVVYDPRNRLYYFLPKYLGRHYIEGELFLLLTLHNNGFVEIDFIDPSTVNGGGDEDSGIFFHPTKTQMPLYYSINYGAMNVHNRKIMREIIPSVFIARYPELKQIPIKSPGFSSNMLENSRNRGQKFRKIGGFNRFIVSWDKGLLTKRAISHLRTVIEWLNHYENLKKYEIDHKKSSGAYLWVVEIEDARTFKLWLSLTDEDRRKTGLMAKKTPGSMLVLPPGMKLICVNPSLTSIKDQDTDILHMISAGLNIPSDVLTGQSSGPYASVKASRGPMSDRISDQIAYFDRFMKFDFFGSIFFLKQSLGVFPEYINVEEVVGFKPKEDDEPEEIIRRVRKMPEKLIEISYPVSEITNYEARAKAFLGVKHGPMSESLGVPNEEIARRMGFGNYRELRLKKATEDRIFPSLAYEMGVDTESLQESTEGEPGKTDNED